MKHSNHGIVKNKMGEEQPRDKQRAQTVHEARREKSVSREATRDPKRGNADKASRSGVASADDGKAPAE